MIQNCITKKIYERLPIYVNFLNTIEESSISSTTIAKSLNFGEVQVRKDLALVSGKGRPKTGYPTKNLVKDIKRYMGINSTNKAVIIGFGKLGKALFEYNGFSEFGIDIVKAFDLEITNEFVYDLSKLESHIKEHKIKFGILTVSAEAAQPMANRLVSCGVLGIWNFTSERLKVPSNIVILNENLAASLSVLIKLTIDREIGGTIGKSN